MKDTNEKEYLTALSIECGIITLITTEGDITHYRQRGIDQIPDEQVQLLISMGMLRRNWYSYPELPSHICLYYEDSAILGNVKCAYPIEIIEARKITPKLSKKYLGKAANFFL